MTIRRLLRSSHGTAALEFALIAPILLLLAAGIVEMGLIFNVYDSTNRVAAQYASAWADCSDTPSGACQMELANYTTPSAKANFAPALDPAQLTLNLFQVKMSGTTPQLISAYPVGAAMNAAQIAAAQAAFTQDKQVGVVVTASYTHTLKFFSNLMSPALGSLLSPTYTVAQLKSSSQ